MKIDKSPNKSPVNRSVMSTFSQRKQVQDAAVGTISSQDSRNVVDFESKGVDTVRSKDDNKSIDFAEESLEGTSIEGPTDPAPTMMFPQPP